MTETAGEGRGVSSGGASSTLPFDPKDLMSMRVLPAKFAAMCGVSKQAVSQWIKRGTITLMPDGTLDPVKASRQVFENSDPARLRARIFKTAMQSRDELRSKIGQMESTVATLRAQLRAFEFRARHEEALRVHKFCLAIEDEFADLVKAERTGDLQELLDQISSEVFYGAPRVGGEVGDCDQVDALPLSPAKSSDE